MHVIKLGVERFGSAPLPVMREGYGEGRCRVEQQGACSRVFPFVAKDTGGAVRQILDEIDTVDAVHIQPYLRLRESTTVTPGGVTLVEVNNLCGT